MAVLHVPGLNERARVFDIDVTLEVDVPAGVVVGDHGAWHELTVEFDGSVQWSRRVNSHNPGATDGLDYHRRVRLDAEMDLRIRALVKTRGVSIRRLCVEAREELE